MDSSIKLLYANINSYNQRRHLINYYVENNNVNIIDNNTSGGNLIQASKELRLGKTNPPSIIGPLNEALHFTIPFLNDKSHDFFSLHSCKLNY